jgi:low affinity Fe/Cu permease
LSVASTGSRRRDLPDGLPDPEHSKPGRAAIQTKLDESIRAGAAQNTFIGIEHLTEEELNKIRRRIETYATQAGETVLEAVKEKAAKAADRATGLE